MREVLAHPGAQGERILHRRVDVGGAFDVTKSLVDQVRGCLRESQDRALTALACGLDQFLKPRQVGHIGGGGDEVEMLFTKFLPLRVEFAQGHGSCAIGAGLVRQHHGLRLHLQPMVLLEDIELVHPVAEGVVIRGDMGVGRGDQPEGKAALLVIVHGPQAHFVVALGDRPVILELRNMRQVIPVHATTA